MIFQIFIFFILNKNIKMINLKVKELKKGGKIGGYTIY